MLAKHQNPAIIQSIQSWLLSPEIQLTEGPHAGGIAGWLNEQDSPEFLYPEIAGYYLTWLTFLTAACDLPVEPWLRAGMVIRWLSSQFEDGGMPPTRLYAKDRKENWRNDARFSFDIVMILRGIVLASARLDGKCDTEKLAWIAQSLRCFIDTDGSLKPYINVSSGAAHRFPQRWSLQPGPYQLKAAAALLSLPSEAMTPGLQAAAATLYRRWRGYYEAEQLSGDLHPIFYFLEGLLLAAASGIDGSAWSSAVLTYSKLMMMQCEDGSLPSGVDENSGPVRSDVLAQALRIGCVMRSRGFLSGWRWEEQLQRLRCSLESYVQKDGSVRFCIRGAANHRNTWAAIFAHQALFLFETLSSGGIVEDDWLKLLI